jgi:hypothetical protein
MRRITASNELSRHNARKGTEMNKNELVAAVAEKSGISKGDATSAVEAVLKPSPVS